MADNNSGPAEAVKGAMEDVRGRAEEAIGTATGDGDLDAARNAAQADAARGATKTAEQRQISHQ